MAPRRLENQMFEELKRRNLATNSREVEDGSPRLESLPLSLYVDINLKCNMRCPSCFRSDPRHRDKVWPTMEYGIFKEVARELFPTAYRVILSGGGESLLHKQFDRMLKTCLEYRVRPIIYTNGTTLNRKRVTLLARAGTYLGISIDGAGRETFEKTRYPAKWDRMVRSLELVRKTREEVGNDDFFPYLGVVVQKDNLGELADFVDMAEKYGFELIKFTKLDPYFPALQSKMPDPDEADRAFVNVLQRANERRVRVNVPDYGDTAASSEIRALRKGNLFPISIDGNDPDRFVKYPGFSSKACSIPFSETMITPEGNVVVSCCSSYQLGDLKQAPFSEIWNNQRYQELRRTVNSDEPMPFCRNDTCPFRK